MIRPRSPVFGRPSLGKPSMLMIPGGRDLDTPASKNAVAARPTTTFDVIEGGNMSAYTRGGSVGIRGGASSPVSNSPLPTSMQTAFDMVKDVFSTPGKPGRGTGPNDSGFNAGGGNPAGNPFNSDEGKGGRGKPIAHVEDAVITTTTSPLTGGGDGGGSGIFGSETPGDDTMIVGADGLVTAGGGVGRYLVPLALAAAAYYAYTRYYK